MPHNEQAPFFCTEPYQQCPSKLIPVQEFCSLLVPNNPSKTKILSKNLYGYISANCKMSPYYSVTSEYLLNFTNAPDAYMTAVILPPEKIDYHFVKFDEKGKYAIHAGVVTIPARTEEIRAIPKPPRPKRARVFDKSNSMFKNWHEDTPKQLEFILNKDFEYGKLGRMIRSKIEKENIIQLLQKNYLKLKEEFLSIIVKSIYPAISWNDFTTYCQQKEITNKDVTLSVLDRLFITVNATVGGKDEHSTTGGNATRELCRYEFIEILVRIAGAKYKDTGITSFLCESVERFFKELFSIGQLPAIHEFRKKYIWTLPVDDIIRSNREGIKKVFQRYAGIKKYIAPNDAVQLIEKDCGYTIYRPELMKAYGYSKMTIKDELEHLGFLNMNIILNRRL